MAPRKQGKIVNIGSVAAMAPSPWSGAYASSKAALHAKTDTLRLELSHFGIGVVAVVPGAIKLNIGQSTAATYSRMPEWKLFNFPRSKSKSTPTDEFAEQTVAALLRKKPSAWFSHGQYSFFMSIMYHLPLYVRD
ncbi:hypothetical protein QN277_006402 [Acacia crassicarpa]|uniref:Uncharacterized protein n=1 Tax=Acacia crassicarpa TaxID=499986 RepID=A0AAE1JS90_9FABA|nr:hypothetical protein QN277_006402 [Acacia crassicarpa]